MWAGCEPHSLWRSEDGGAHFELNTALWDHPHRPQWMPGAGGAAIHTIVPRRDGSMLVAMSTGGVYRSADSNGGWVPANRGIKVDFQPEEYPEFNQCVHRIAVDAVDQSHVFAQNHGGVYFSSDSGDSWRPIMDGLPADFGFAVTTHPRRGGVAYVSPVNDGSDRYQPDYRCRVYRTEDAGASWTALSAGLPAEDHYGVVLRDALRTDDADPVGVYFGNRNGEVYASADEGDTWQPVASHLPDVLCVRAAVV